MAHSDGIENCGISADSTMSSRTAEVNGDCGPCKPADMNKFNSIGGNVGSSYSKTVSLK